MLLILSVIVGQKDTRYVGASQQQNRQRAKIHTPAV
jgi:hypothetical protein